MFSNQLSGLFAQATRVLRDAVSQQNVAREKACNHACSATQQSGLVEVGFHLGRERVGGWVQKRTKEGSDPQGMSLTKGLEAETATRPKIQPRLKHRGKDKPLALESWSLLQAYRDMQGKKHPTEANSTRAFLLERCLEVQALRCRRSDDARPLHLPASHAEPVGMPPL